MENSVCSNRQNLFTENNESGQDNTTNFTYDMKPTVRHKNIINEYHSSLPLLKKVVSAMVSPNDVDDIIQDLYIHTYNKSLQQEKVKKPKSFLLRTAINLALKNIRVSKREYLRHHINGEKINPELYSNDIDTTFENFSSQNRYTNFCKFVINLPLQCQTAYILKKFYGYSQVEISLKMNISESTVEKHIANGTKKCLQFKQ